MADGKVEEERVFEGVTVGQAVPDPLMVFERDAEGQNDPDTLRVNKGEVVEEVVVVGEIEGVTVALGVIDELAVGVGLIEGEGVGVDPPWGEGVRFMIEGLACPVVEKKLVIERVRVDWTDKEGSNVELFNGDLVGVRAGEDEGVNVEPATPPGTPPSPCMEGVDAVVGVMPEGEGGLVGVGLWEADTVLESEGEEEEEREGSREKLGLAVTVAFTVFVEVD